VALVQWLPKKGNEVMTENLLFYQKLGFEEEDRRMQDGYRRVFLHKVLV
jgi:ribosomal protein S18 acetylase RimI-like enzyme